MEHGHPHTHHGHPLRGTGALAVPPSLDGSVPDEHLSPEEMSRRRFLRGVGLLGAGMMSGVVLAGSAPTGAGRQTLAADRRWALPPSGAGYHWLAGDHHVHTRYSEDGLYRVVDQVWHAWQYGLDWMAITDHGGTGHARVGVEKVNPEICAARAEFRDMLVFQGLEWNIPAAEHGTVLVHPGQGEIAVLQQFENSFDGVVRDATASNARNEALAIAGITFLADAVASQRVADALVFANHPARRGIDSAHEIRGWRDAKPWIAVGMEGAPGHQAAGIPAPKGAGSSRGAYDGEFSEGSFAEYPPDSYRTFGGFDWMTATVGGLWDSLLAEGKPWWITANSDSHMVYADRAVHGPGSDFAVDGYHSDPVDGGTANLTNGDFWPGCFSRTHVGARTISYAGVMEGLRAGRIWVDHGGLISGLQVEARAVGSPAGVTLGEILWVAMGTAIELVITIDLATSANWARFVPKLARVDVISGEVTGPATDRDTFVAPTARVVKSFEVNRTRGRVTLTYAVGPAVGPRYFRIRGTDGNRTAVGVRGASVDPAGPAIDVAGDSDPWRDLWFYANPIWVRPG